MKYLKTYRLFESDEVNIIIYTLEDIFLQLQDDEEIHTKVYFIRDVEDYIIKSDQAWRWDGGMTVGFNTDVMKVVIERAIDYMKTQGYNLDEIETGDHGKITYDRLINGVYDFSVELKFTKID
jgi:hypothetical protein